MLAASAKHRQSKPHRKGSSRTPFFMACASLAAQDATTLIGSNPGKAECIVEAFNKRPTNLEWDGSFPTRRRGLFGRVQPIKCPSSIAQNNDKM